MNLKIELLDTLLLNDFPSASSVTFCDGRLYLAGDDAGYILIMDTVYRETGRIILFDFKGKRIPKPLKADIESSVMITIEQKKNLLLLGSASRPNRMQCFLVPLMEPALYDLSKAWCKTFSLNQFIKRLQQGGIDEINVEGCTLAGDNLILSNRGNRARPANYLVVTDKNFWENQQHANIFIIELTLPVQEVQGLSVSELCYVSSRDMLLFLLTSEATCNAYDDGLIADSYMGWINDFTAKTKLKTITAHGMINLALADKQFKGEKAEGMCIEKEEGNKLLIHLVSDNDAGTSRFFKIKLTLQSS